MQFPSISETFASTDIHALLRTGSEVAVYSMRSKHKDSKKMIKNRCLESISLYYSGCFEWIYGLLYSFIHINKLVKISLWILRCEIDRPKEIIKCLILVPSAFYIYKNLKINRPDIVHLFWGHYPSLVGFLLLQSNERIRISMFLGAYDLELGLGISRYMSREVDLIFTHAQMNLQRLRKIGIDKSKIHMVYRGIYCKHIHTNFTKIKGRVLTAGNLCKEKRFDLVIMVIKKAIESGHELTLEIAGSGRERPSLEKMVKKLSLTKNVFFVGNLNQKDLFKKMSCSEFFLFLSEKDSERLPNVLKEAMYHKCVCISSKTIGINELIDSNQNGFIFSKDRYNHISDCFNLNQYNIDNIGNKAHKKIINNFDVDSTMNQYISLWRGV
jgi:glycosyltransferase involved in cell wall biosynthesis